MTTQPSPPPLEYRSPPGEDELEDRPPPFGFAVGAVIGFALYLVSAAILVAFVLHAMPRVSTTVVAGLLLLAGMVVFSIYANARWRWRGVFAGLLLGLGLTLLIPGICFVVLLNS